MRRGGDMEEEEGIRTRRKRQTRRRERRRAPLMGDATDDTKTGRCERTE